MSRDQNITMARISLGSLTAEEEKPNWNLENVDRRKKLRGDCISQPILIIHVSM
jgi:hypothetical protein